VTVPRFPPANTNKHIFASKVVNKGKFEINQYSVQLTHLEYLQMGFQNKANELCDYTIDNKLEFHLKCSGNRTKDKVIWMIT